MKASEDKTFPGAIVASLASPSGQAVAAVNRRYAYLGSYRGVFAHGLYETFTGLLAVGAPIPPRTPSGSFRAAATCRWFVPAQQPDQRQGRA